MPRLENLPQTRISFRRSANNLHIATGEDLDLEQARAILNLMRCHSNDCNKFFIDVRHVTRIQPAAAAALRLCAETGADCGGLSIELDKSIPVCAGLAGGSADAAAVLRGLNRLLGLGLPPERLEAIGARVGSDVPYCVRGGTALAEGRGEVLTTLPALPDCHVVLCKPAFSVPTPELFARLDGCRIRRRPDTAGLLAALAAGDLAGVARRMYNVFEDVLPERRGAEVQRIKNALVQQGALGASMSGTGSTVFGLFDREEAARRAYELLQESYRDTFLARSLEKMV